MCSGPVGEGANRPSNFRLECIGSLAKRLMLAQSVKAMGYSRKAEFGVVTGEYVAKLVATRRVYL